MPKQYKIFKAEYQFNCVLCGKQHPKGTRAFFENEKLIAADCKWPQKAKGGITQSNYTGQAHPNSITGEAQPEKKAGGSLALQAELITAQNFIKAKEAIDAQVPNASEYQNYLDAITEYMRQLNNNQWLELEKKKLGIK